MADISDTEIREFISIGGGLPKMDDLPSLLGSRRWFVTWGLSPFLFGYILFQALGLGWTGSALARTAKAPRTSTRGIDAMGL